MSTRSAVGFGWGWLIAPPAAMFLLAALVQVTTGDAALFLWLNNAVFPLGEVFWSSVTLLGDGLVLFVLLGFMARRHGQLVWSAWLATFFAILWTHGLKYLTGHALRPPSVLPAYAFHIIGRLLHAGSFPSGHATTTFAVGGVLAAYLRNPIPRVALIAVGGAIAFSRVAVGVHWPSDVLIGAAGGWVAGALGVAAARHWDYATRPAGRRLMANAWLIAALALLLRDPHYPDARWLQYAIAGSAAIVAVVARVAIALRRRQPGAARAKHI
ncbi:MAG: phosphatase PAP2 family protein [Sulfurifustaceae bacterium]